jgi:hypothetical protein
MRDSFDAYPSVLSFQESKFTGGKMAKDKGDGGRDTNF